MSSSGSVCNCTPVPGRPAALWWFLWAPRSLPVHGAPARCGLRASSSEGLERGRARQRPTRWIHRVQTQEPPPREVQQFAEGCAETVEPAPTRTLWARALLGAGRLHPHPRAAPAAALPPRGDLESESFADSGIYRVGR